MTGSGDGALLDALLDSWDRNNTILVNLLRALPDDVFSLRAADGSPTISALFAHIHYVRLVFVAENVPELAVDVPAREWAETVPPAQLAPLLDQSARTVRDAVRTRVMDGRPMALHYDHPVLMLQHMIWHEGYHHGQIKLALKLAGRPLSNAEAGPLTWGIWMKKT